MTSPNGPGGAVPPGIRSPYVVYPMMGRASDTRQVTNAEFDTAFMQEQSQLTRVPASPAVGMTPIVAGLVGPILADIPAELLMMETKPGPVHIKWGDARAWDPFKQKDGKTGYRNKSGKEQIIWIQFKDVDGLTKTQTHVIQPGGEVVNEAGNGVTVRPVA